MQSLHIIMDCNSLLLQSSRESGRTIVQHQTTIYKLFTPSLTYIDDIIYKKGFPCIWTSIFEPNQMGIEYVTAFFAMQHSFVTFFDAIPFKSRGRRSRKTEYELNVSMRQQPANADNA